MLEVVENDQELMEWALNTKTSKNTPKTQEITVSYIISTLLEKITNNSPKIAWNACVSIGNILQEEHIRNFECNILFSNYWFDLLLGVIKDRPNYKTKIHASQTLAKYKTYEEYGDKFYEVLYESLVCLEGLNNISDFPEYKYIEKLQIWLIDLISHLITWIEETKSETEQMSKLLTEHSGFIRTVLIDYLKGNKYFYFYIH